MPNVINAVELCELYNQCAEILYQYGLYREHNTLKVSIELCNKNKRLSYKVSYDNDIQVAAFYPDFLLQELQKQAKEYSLKTI